MGRYEQNIQFTVSLSTMRKTSSLIAVAILIATFNLIALQSASAAAVTPQTLATKIAKAGLGCKTITEKTKMLFNGNKWICTANGERVSIEVYPAASWKVLQELACAWDYGFIAITDNKTWMVIAESRATSKKLVKPLGGSLKVFCNAKNIYNEVKSKTPAKPKPTPSATPSPSPSIAVAGTWAKPFSWDATIEENGFPLQLNSFEQGKTEAICKKKAELIAASPNDYNLEILGELCPLAENRFNPDAAKESDYSVLNLSYTNKNEKIDSPSRFLYKIRISDSQGKIYEPEFITEMDGQSLSIDAIPGGTISTTVYFQLPKSFNPVGARIEVGVYDKTYYWLIK
jgi:hypothetical protein